MRLEGNFPTRSPLLASREGQEDAFVTKTDASGSTLDFSTYLGGSANDAGYGIAVDSTGNMHVVGRMESTSFPIQVPLQAVSAGGGRLRRPHRRRVRVLHAHPCRLLDTHNPKMGEL
jgi:hypothetical protein